MIVYVPYYLDIKKDINLKLKITASDDVLTMAKDIINSDDNLSLVTLDTRGFMIFDYFLSQIFKFSNVRCILYFFAIHIYTYLTDCKGTEEMISKIADTCITEMNKQENCNLTLTGVSISQKELKFLEDYFNHKK